MKYDHKLVRESNKKRAETELKEAVKKVLKTGLYYEDVCEIVAKAVNEVAEEKENERKSKKALKEINQKTPEEVFEEGIRFPNFKVMKTESFRFKGSEPNIAELPVSKEKGL